MIRLKTIVLLILVSISSLVHAYFSNKRANRSKKDYARVVNSSTIIGERLTFLTGENHQLIAQNQTMTLRAEELQLLLPELKRQITSLKVKLKNTESFNITGFSIETPAEVILRDSLIYDTVAVKIFDYNDGYFRIQGSSNDNQLNLNMSYQDTLVQVVYRGERVHPWLWVFSKRKLMQRVSLKNPNAQIHYTRHIKIQ